MNTTSYGRSRRFPHLAAAALLAASGSAFAGADAPPADDESTPPLFAAVRDAARELGAEARARLTQDAGSGPLRAAVMEVKGRVEWRADEKDDWRRAKVDDVIDPGSRIRTGRESMMAMRVGHNATVMVESHTRMALPRVLREGETLRTVIEVSRGRADIKVDRVGLTNDFSVVTPSGTLAVRGTGFAVDYGGLEGTRVHAAQFNEIASIEVRYFLERFATAISARAVTTNRHPNPAVAQLFKSFGPPRVISAVLEAEATPELLMATMGNHNRRARRRDIRRRAVNQAEEGPQHIYVFDEFARQQFDNPVTGGQIAHFICQHLTGVFYRYAMNLNFNGLGVSGLPNAQMQLQNFCVNHMGVFREEELQAMVNIVVGYCVNQHAPSQHDVDQCIQDFFKAVVDEYNHIF